MTRATFGILATTGALVLFADLTSCAISMAMTIPRDTSAFSADLSFGTFAICDAYITAIGTTYFAFLAIFGSAAICIYADLIQAQSPRATCGIIIALGADLVQAYQTAHAIAILQAAHTN
jgi:hypothetical protein